MEDPWIYLKWKHICEHRLGLIWHPAPSFCFFPNLFLYLSQGPDREPPQFSSCGRFGGPHPSQAEGKHRSVWRLQSWSFSPYEVKETHTNMHPLVFLTECIPQHEHCQSLHIDSSWELTQVCVLWLWGTMHPFNYASTQFLLISIFYQTSQRFQ